MTLKSGFIPLLHELDRSSENCAQENYWQLRNGSHPPLTNKVQTNSEAECFVPSREEANH